MKLSSITAALGINKTAKTAKTVAQKAVAVTKPAAKKASGAEALAAQNKAMIKMENPRSLKATSGAGREPGFGAGGDDFALFDNGAINNGTFFA